MHAAVEQVDQAFERAAADAGESFGEHVGAQRHRRAHRADRERFADAGRVAAEQIELERAERAARNGGVGQRAEAGVDPVDGFVARGLAIDDGPCRVDARGGGRREPDRGAFVRDRDEAVERQRVAVEQNHLKR